MHLNKGGGSCFIREEYIFLSPRKYKHKCQLITYAQNYFFILNIRKVEGNCYSYFNPYLEK